MNGSRTTLTRATSDLKTQRYFPRRLPSPAFWCPDRTNHISFLSPLFALAAATVESRGPERGKTRQDSPPRGRTSRAEKADRSPTGRSFSESAGALSAVAENLEASSSSPFFLTPLRRVTPSLASPYRGRRSYHTSL